MSFLFSLLSGVSSLYMILILIRVLMTWVASPYALGRPGELLATVTDPYMNWFRRFPLRIGMLDLSPILALGVLSVANSVFSSLARSGYISIGIVLALVASIAWSAVSFFLTFGLIILALRLFAYITNRNIFTPFWRIIDSISQPIVNRIARIISRHQALRYGTALGVSVGAFLLLRVVGGTLASWGISLLARLPF
jgi:YggT family protein